MSCEGERMDISMVLGGQDSMLLASSPDQAVNRLKHPCEEQVNASAMRTQKKGCLPRLTTQRYNYNMLTIIVL